MASDPGLAPRRPIPSQTGGVWLVTAQPWCQEHLRERQGQRLGRDDAHRDRLAHNGAHHGHHGSNSHDDTHYGQLARDVAHHGRHAGDHGKKETEGQERERGRGRRGGGAGGGGPAGGEGQML